MNTFNKIDNRSGKTTAYLKYLILCYCECLRCRYNDIKQDIAEELAGLREEGATLENVSDIRFFSFKPKDIGTLHYENHHLSVIYNRGNENVKGVAPTDDNGRGKRNPQSALQGSRT